MAKVSGTLKTVLRDGLMFPFLRKVWCFVALSHFSYVRSGRLEAKEAGRLMKEAGLEFDLAYSSVLRRAITTLWIGMEEMECQYIPQKLNWRLNERHYGALAGLDKAETAEKFGAEQVLIWRRSFDVPPPFIEKTNPESPVRHTLLQCVLFTLC
jgi:2,3-bisphosphoglycerate-dependent phosphoglycerate mutase